MTGSDPEAPAALITLEADGTYTLAVRHTYPEDGAHRVRVRSGCGATGAGHAGHAPLEVAWRPALTDPATGVLSCHAPDLPDGTHVEARFGDGAVLTGVAAAGGVWFGEHTLPGGSHDVVVAARTGTWHGHLTIEGPAVPKRRRAPAKRRPRKTAA